LQRGFLTRDGKLARRWWLWCLAALMAFAITSGVGLAAMTSHLGSRSWEIAGDSGLVFSCAASSLAFLALFVRFANKRTRLFDSLNENAYGIYLVHYAFVSWLQLAVLKMQMPALAKGSLVFFGSVLLSWGTAALLRRIPWTTQRHV
jgi:surface polysaccharide O-acyltransferase-like enzyme